MRATDRGPEAAERPDGPAGRRRRWRPVARERLGLANPNEAAAVVARYLRSAPGTMTYLFTVFITTVSLRAAGPDLTDALIRSESTNVHNMLHNPVRGLIASAFWIDTSRWPVALVLLFVVVMAPTERRIGTARWLAVGAAGHIGATVATTIGISIGVSHHLLRPSLTHAADVGISYFAIAVATAYVALLPGRLPWLGRAVIVGYVVVNVAASQTFTDYGHLVAAAVGFALAPWAVRGASWRHLHGPRELRSPR